MDPLDFLIHLLNFLAPALAVAVLLTAISSFLVKKSPSPSAPWSEFAINFVVGAGVLAGGLVLYGHEGKMVTYLILVLAMATSHWGQRGGWRK